MKIYMPIIVAISLLLMSCGPDKETEKKAEVKDKPQQTTILQPHLKTLNQAKNMQQTLQDAETARKKKMDEQEGNADEQEPN